MGEPTEFLFAIGDKVKDTITGFEGLVECRTQWITNCNTYGVRSQNLHEGRPIEIQIFDEPKLKLVKAKKAEVKKAETKEEEPEPKKRRTGGPTPAIKPTNRL